VLRNGPNFELIAGLCKMAVEAERQRLLATDIHSCHANCERFACVQTRKAVEAERKECAKVAETIQEFGLNVATAIRARGQA
jgi:hypothetical protein